MKNTIKPSQDKTVEKKMENCKECKEKLRLILASTHQMGVNFYATEERTVLFACANEKCKMYQIVLVDLERLKNT